MSAAVTAGRRVLPRGYLDLFRQAAIWFGFLFAYQFARGIADRDPSKAFVNGWRVLDFEQRVTHHVFELTLQQVADSSGFLKSLVAVPAGLANNSGPPKPIVNDNRQTVVCHGYPGAVAENKNGTQGTPGLDPEQCRPE